MELRVLGGSVPRAWSCGGRYRQQAKGTRGRQGAVGDGLDGYRGGVCSDYQSEGD